MVARVAVVVVGEVADVCSVVLEVVVVPWIVVVMVVEVEIISVPEV